MLTIAVPQVPRRDSGGNLVPSLASPNKVKRDSGSTPDGDEDGGGPSTPVRQSSQRKIVLVDPKEETDDGHSLRVATEKFQALLHLDSDEILQDSVEVRDVASGSFLMKQDSMQETALVYILVGTLTVSQHDPEGNEDVKLFTACPGDLVGGLAVLSGDPSFFTVKAKHGARIATITRATFFK